MDLDPLESSQISFECPQLLLFNKIEFKNQGASFIVKVSTLIKLMNMCLDILGHEGKPIVTVFISPDPARKQMAHSN